MSYDVNSLEAHWMPFTANRDFKSNPRMVVKSEGMYMWDYKGGQIIDGSSALFCTPAGHGRREIAEAVYNQMLANDYAPHFQLGHPGSFELAERVCRLLPGGIQGSKKRKKTFYSLITAWRWRPNAGLSGSTNTPTTPTIRTVPTPTSTPGTAPILRLLL